LYWNKICEVTVNNRKRKEQEHTMSQKNRYGYILNRQPEKKEPGRYHKLGLLLMTTFQLREICRTEKIVQGIVNLMDKDEFIRVILRYRGEMNTFSAPF